MINAGILTATENVSSAQNGIKQAISEQKLHRVKSKALGDVQNTLHSRPSNFGNPNINSAAKLPCKSASHLKPASHENYLPSRNTSGKKINDTPCGPVVKTSLNSPFVDNEVFETHLHMLCEEDQQSYFDDYFSEYKFSEEQIENLVRSVKSCARPRSVPSYEPCEDIEIPAREKYEENSFSISDILSDIILPEVPPI